MKSMKKLLALALVFVMLTGLAITASAASITISQDSTYSGTENQAGRVYTYKQIFRATLASSNSSTGGGYDADGTPGTVTASLAKGYSYYLNTATDSAQIAELGTWDATTKAWTKASGNLWFKLTPSADGTQYIVEWDNSATDTDTAQAAAKWLSKNYTALASDTLTWNATDKTWTATGLENGYYLISGDTGDNLVAATSDIQIAEKNSYPPLDKTQADEDDPVVSDGDRKVAVGDVLNYQVKVTIPATAAAGETIEVYDAPSKGLSYNSDSMKVTVDGTEVTPAAGAAVAPATLKTGDAWRYTITVSAANKGKDVVFSFTMTVTADALTDPDKMNPSGLIYNEYDSIPDKVYFKTYYTGIIKVDGEDSTVKLEGVKFVLKENGVTFPVSKNTDGYYVPTAAPDTSSMTAEEAAAALDAAATVVTDANGKIIIRGLDEDKTYTLTEIETNEGYNLLVGDKELVLIEDGYDKDGKPTFDPSTQFDTIENNKGTVLPSTGGIGTTLFYVFGTLLVLAAGVVLVTKRRVRE